MNTKRGIPADAMRTSSGGTNSGLRVLGKQSKSGRRAKPGAAPAPATGSDTPGNTPKRGRPRKANALSHLVIVQGTDGAPGIAIRPGPAPKRKVGRPKGASTRPDLQRLFAAAMNQSRNAADEVAHQCLRFLNAQTGRDRQRIRRDYQWFCLAAAVDLFGRGIARSIAIDAVANNGATVGNKSFHGSAATVRRAVAAFRHEDFSAISDEKT